DAVDEPHRILRGVALVRVDANRRAPVDDPLHGGDVMRVGACVETDLHLHRFVTTGQKSRELVAQARVVVALQQAEQRYAPRVIGTQQRMAAGMVERAGERTRKKRRARGERVQAEPTVARRQAAQRFDEVRGKVPRTFDGLVGIPGKKRRFAVAASAVVEDDLDDERVVMRDGAERQAVGTHERDSQARSGDGAAAHGTHRSPRPSSATPPHSTTASIPRPNASRESRVKIATPARPPTTAMGRQTSSARPVRPPNPIMLVYSTSVRPWL